METLPIENLRETSWKRISRDPFVDWIFMLLIAFTTAAIFIVIGITSYINAADVAYLVPEQTTTTSTLPIDARDLTRVVQGFGNSKVEPVPGDPSL